MGPGLKVAWPKRRSEPMKEYANFILYDHRLLQEKMDGEWKGWKIIAITNEHSTTLGAIIKWRVWVERELN